MSLQCYQTTNKTWWWSLLYLCIVTVYCIPTVARTAIWHYLLSAT